MRAVRRNGFAPTAVRAARSVRLYGPVNSLRRASVLCENYEWYRLDLPPERPAVALADGFSLVPGANEDRRLYAELDAMNAKLVDTRKAAGGQLWLVVRDEDRRPAFACWIFPSRTPVGTARSGWLELPPDVVCLEDSVTGPDFRGLRLAPAAWAALAAKLAVGGTKTIVTKIEEDNVPCQRAVEKVGFRRMDDDDAVLGFFAPQLWAPTGA